ncbi:MAG: hypothetical protein JW924_03260 [Fusobacteriaceae bacterium]|nr:hypothetical protein [Fusobacteriaceae bacterium]
MYSRPKNNVETTIASLSSNTLTVNTGDGALFPSTPFYLTLFDSVDSAPDSTAEIVYCIYRSGDVLTVIRAQQGTSQTAWGIGDKVWLGLTAEHLQSLNNASLPLIDRTIETDATLFESYSDEFDSDTILESGSDWAWLNQGTATITAKPDLSSIEMYVPLPANENSRAIIRSIPDLSGTDDWEIITKILGIQNNNSGGNYSEIGLILYESGTGKAISIGFGTDNGICIRIPRWNSIGNNSFASMVAKLTIDWRPANNLYIKIKIDRTNSKYIFYYSLNGVYFDKLAEENFTNFFTAEADKIGLSVTSHPTLGQNIYVMYDYFRMIKL